MKLYLLLLPCALLFSPCLRATDWEKQQLNGHVMSVVFHKNQTGYNLKDSSILTYPDDYVYSSYFDSIGKCTHYDHVRSHEYHFRTIPQWKGNKLEEVFYSQSYGMQRLSSTVTTYTSDTESSFEKYGYDGVYLKEYGKKTTTTNGNTRQTRTVTYSAQNKRNINDETLTEIFDDQGRVIEEKLVANRQLRHHYKYLYVSFDEHYNWTERFVYYLKGNTSAHICRFDVRNISYY